MPTNEGLDLPMGRVKLGNADPYEIHKGDKGLSITRNKTNEIYGAMYMSQTLLVYALVRLDYLN